MGIIGRLLGSARRGTATTAPSRRTGRRGTTTGTGTGRRGGLLSGLLRRKGL